MHKNHKFPTGGGVLVNLSSTLHKSAEGVPSMADVMIPMATGGLVTGTYAGDGAETRTINLGFRPKAVYVCLSNGATYFNGTTKMLSGGLAVENGAILHNGHPVLVISDTGFIVGYKYPPGSGIRAATNEEGLTYHYIAFRR